MTDFSTMTLGALRKIAMGIVPGASRRTKAELVAALTPVTFDRGERDRLRPVAVLVFDPAGHLTAAQRNTRDAQNRWNRRHIRYRSGAVGNIPARRRVTGVMRPVTRLELAVRRVALGVA